MALSEKQINDIHLAAQAFLKIRRPDPELRDKLDIGYRIEKQSVLIFEIRPLWGNPKQKEEYPLAKTTYIMTRKKWKILWRRSDLKWHGYDPDLYVNSISDFFQVVDKDDYSCFFG